MRGAVFRCSLRAEQLGENATDLSPSTVSSHESVTRAALLLVIADPQHLRELPCGRRSLSVTRTPASRFLVQPLLPVCGGQSRNAASANDDGSLELVFTLPLVGPPFRGKRERPLYGRCGRNAVGDRSFVNCATATWSSDRRTRCHGFTRSRALRQVTDRGSFHRRIVVTTPSQKEQAQC
jgi:hypothetical protein